MTVKVKFCGGGPLLPPPHAAKLAKLMTQRMSRAKAVCERSRLVPIRLSTIVNATAQSSRRSSIGFHGQSRGLRSLGNNALGGVVTVTVTFCELVPSRVSEEGKGVHVPPVGPPEQFRLTTWLKPPSGDTLIV